MSRKTVVSMVAGVAASGVAFYAAFRNVPFGGLMAYLGGINYWWVVPAVAGIMAAFLIRVVRWQYILNSDALPARSAGAVGFAGAYHPLMIGFMLNSVMPGRVGEAARPLILRRLEAIPFSKGLATVAVERMFDVGLLAALFLWVMATVTIDPGLEIRFAGFILDKELLVQLGWNMSVLALALLTAIGLVCVGAVRDWIKRIILKAPKMVFFASDTFKEALGDRISRPLVSMVDNVGQGFSLMQNPLRVAGCASLTVLIWFLQALTFYIVMFGAPGIYLTFPEMTAVMVIICFFIALPSVPGYWGIWEAGGVFAMGLFGVPAKEAAGFNLANHAIQMFPVFVAGVFSAWMIGVGIVNISKEKPGPAPAGAGNKG